MVSQSSREGKGGGRAGLGTDGCATTESDERRGDDSGNGGFVVVNECNRRSSGIGDGGHRQAHCFPTNRPTERAGGRAGRGRRSGAERTVEGRIGRARGPEVGQGRGGARRSGGRAKTGRRSGEHGDEQQGKGVDNGSDRSGYSPRLGTAREH